MKPGRFKGMVKFTYYDEAFVDKWTWSRPDFMDT
jgi:hypothetical protein